MATDWGLGHYERIAEELLPAARAVVERAAIAEGERVVDVGTGSGNGALLAAERGAVVTGVDPAARLLEVARERVPAADFVTGDAANVPLGDGEADVVMSVFGVIFAPDPEAAARELARVCAPGGRIVLSAWIPEGAMSRSVRVPREAVRKALGLPEPPPPFPWHERAALAELFGREVTLHEESLAFTGESAAAYIDAELASHPLAVAGNAVLEPRGEAQAVRDEMVAIFEAANEDPGAFRTTSRFVVAVIR
jgi:SAM-dependent methyltransferase